MKEYVERAAIHELVKRIPKYEMFNYDRTEALLGINPDDINFGVDKIPAADVAEVRHAAKAESADRKTGLICTACYLDIDADAVYCKYCGALLDGKEGEHEVG